jgi:hypothetical protein
MNDIVADIGRGYGLESTDLPPEVQNFYRFLIALEEKVHDDIDVNVLKAVTHLMTFKLKYNFSNQYHNNIVKLIIDLISAKHNIPKDFIICVGYMYKGRASHVTISDRLISYFLTKVYNKPNPLQDVQQY